VDEAVEFHFMPEKLSLGWYGAEGLRGSDGATGWDGEAAQGAEEEKEAHGLNRAQCNASLAVCQEGNGGETPRCKSPKAEIRGSKAGRIPKVKANQSWNSLPLMDCGR
jgi:hypothetical protein